LRIAQYRIALDKEKCVPFARMFIYGKIRNCRTLLRRNDKECPDIVLERLNQLAKDTLECTSLESLLGTEGSAAQAYFSRFGQMLKSTTPFDFDNRNKRPPKDPVNAILSYIYGILVKDVFNSLILAGFDPYMGLYHQPKHGKPALALDLMEEFRPIIADSTLITLFNNDELTADDFTTNQLGTVLSPKAIKTCVGAYERRINAEVTHPTFGYSVSYRRIIEVQARMLGRSLTGEIPRYEPFMTR